MRTKKMFLMAIVFAVIAVVGMVNDARATATWYTCNVVQLGPTGTGDKVIFKLNDTNSSPAFTGMWFIATPTRAKEMLAVVLTAVSLGKSIMIYTDIAVSATSNPVITTLYLTP